MPVEVTVTSAKVKCGDRFVIIYLSNRRFLTRLTRVFAAP
jgi:hypothetical protein